MIPKVPFKNIYVEPHPYLPYVKKKHFISPKMMPVTYPLTKDKGFLFGQYRTNNFRNNNGPKGDRDIAVPKPESLIRVNCIGGSTTGNYIVYKYKSFSYPMELENILKKQLQSALDKENIKTQRKENRKENRINNRLLTH